MFLCLDECVLVACEDTVNVVLGENAGPRELCVLSVVIMGGHGSCRRLWEVWIHS